MRRTLLALPSLVLLVACASEPEEPTVLSEYMAPIAGGTADSTHRSVMGLASLQGGGFGMCSGTLIAPNLVITAQHCVAPTSGQYVECGNSPFGASYTASNLYATPDSAIAQNSNWYQGAQVYVPPGGNDTCGFDMALIRLSENVTETEPHVPRIDRQVMNGEEYLAVGFGNTSDNGGGGSRRQRGDLSVQCTPGACGFGVTSTEWRGETGICSGDSGGPALDLDGKVIGVVSRGGPNCSTPVYGSVRAWSDWIIEVALEAADKGGYEPPFWATTGSSDPPTGTGGASSGGASSGGASSGGAGGTPSEGGSGVGGATGGGDVGEPCGAPGDCAGSLVCAALSADDDALCTDACAVDADCSDGFVCEGGACFAEASTRNDDAGSVSGCSIPVAPEQDPAKPVPWAVGAMLLGFAIRRRRR